MADRLPMIDWKGRTVGLFGLLDHDTCVAAAEVLLRFRSSSSSKPVHLYLGCAGGSVEDVFLVVDCLSMLGGRLNTYAMSGIGGLAVLFFISGRKRYALPHAIISTVGLIETQRSVGFVNRRNRVDDARAHELIRAQLRRYLDTECVQQLLDEECEITSERALRIGLINQIIGPLCLPIPSPAVMNRHMR